MNDDMDNLVKRHYVAIDDPKGVDGAQMWEGKWWAPLWGCDTLGALLNEIPPASDGETEKLLKEVERLRVIAAAAVRSVSNPAWAGVCDEDVDLERVLREAGLMGGKTK